MLTTGVYVLLFLATRVTHNQAALNKITCSCKYNNLTGINFIIYKCDGNTRVTVPVADPQRLTKMVDLEKRTIFYIFGYLQNSNVATVHDITKALCDRNAGNVVVLDWSKYNGGLYNFAVRKAEEVGALFAHSLQVLADNGLKRSNIYIIGYSLGAHIAGLAGKCNNLPTKISRITALDPANNYIYPFGCYLKPTDANQVDVIHTDGGGFGYFPQTRTIDFYMNKGIAPQPGCPPSIQSITLSVQGLIGFAVCSHEKSVNYYVKSIYNPTKYLAKECSSYLKFKLGACNKNQRISVGYGTPNVKGIFYANT